MKTLFAAALLIVTSGAAYAQYSSGYGGYGYGSNSRSNSVQGHFNPNGSYTQPHQRTAPNNTQYDNYGTRGNYNPYTGQTGTRSPRW